MAASFVSSPHPGPPATCWLLRQLEELASVAVLQVVAAQSGCLATLTRPAQLAGVLQRSTVQGSTLHGAAQKQHYNYCMVQMATRRPVASEKQKS